jgi:hypothetical protein
MIGAWEERANRIDASASLSDLATLRAPNAGLLA